MYYVYILLEGKEGRFYIGQTENIKRRMGEHAAGHNHTTARYSEPKLIFIEGFINKQDAERREKYFKTTKGKQTLRSMLRESLKA